MAINGVGGDWVNVNGTAGADTMSLFPSAVAGHLQVVGSGFPAPVEVSGQLTLSINGLDGPDTISSAGNVAVVGIPVVMDGGEGDDVIGGSNAADTIFGGPGDDVVDGNQGADMVFLGEGDDTFVWDPGDGSDVVEGDEGFDTLAFNGSSAAETLEFSANPGAPGRLRFTRNVSNIVMDVDGVEAVNLRVLGGADVATVNDLSTTVIETIDINLAAGGGGGDAQPDLVIVNGTEGTDLIHIAADGGAVKILGLAAGVRVFAPEATHDGLVVNGRGGADTITADPAVAGLIGLTTNQD